MRVDPSESTKLFKELNRITNTLDQTVLLGSFSLDAYIRVGPLFISPFSLVTIKRGLGDRLARWEFSKAGWRFFFHDRSEVFFKGPLTSAVRDGQILHLKIAAAGAEQPDTPHARLLLRYFKCLDTFYFMLTEVDRSFHLLASPLSDWKNWPL